MTGIYKITNKKDGKIYIGQSTDISRRIAEHKKARFQTIDNYINCLGVENFDFEVLEECPVDRLGDRERFYIEKYQSKEYGYNLQTGGKSDSSGEGNGRAKLREEDIIFIRKAYAEHFSAKEVYEKYFEHKISKSNFQAIWQGKTWPTIMPEVYTQENKQFYISEQMKVKTTLTKEEVLNYRKYYVEHSQSEVFQKFVQDKGKKLSQQSFYKILRGDVRDTSIYKDVPIYRKKKKVWELNGEPVQTILESEE